MSETALVEAKLQLAIAREALIAASNALPLELRLNDNASYPLFEALNKVDGVRLFLSRFVSQRVEQTG